MELQVIYHLVTAVDIFFFFSASLLDPPIQSGFYFFSIKLGKKKKKHGSGYSKVHSAVLSFFYFVKFDPTRGHRRFWLWGPELWNKQISELISSLIGQHVGFLLLLFVVLLNSPAHQRKDTFEQIPTKLMEFYKGRFHSAKHILCFFSVPKDALALSFKGVAVMFLPWWAAQWHRRTKRTLERVTFLGGCLSSSDSFTRPDAPEHGVNVVGIKAIYWCVPRC